MGAAEGVPSRDVGSLGPWVLGGGCWAPLWPLLGSTPESRESAFLLHAPCAHQPASPGSSSHAAVCCVALGKCPNLSGVCLISHKHRVMLRPLFWGQFEDKGSKVMQLCFLSLPLPLRPWPAPRAPVFLQGHKGGLLGFSIHLSLTDKGAEVPRDPHWEGSHGVCLTGQGPWAASSAPRQADGVRTGSMESC